jgi:hypothetical protein
MMGRVGWMQGVAVLACAGLVGWGCSGDEDDDGSSGGGSGNGNHTSSATGGEPAEPPAPGECSSVRMTQYTSSDVRWCGFDRNHASLPQFVRDGMTVAIAEPFNGSSYGGDPGEACGECWEIDTLGGTQLVMVHDLCPVEGNPICAGSHFHFDVSQETAAALGDEWLGEGAVRQVPCPVTGNIQVRVASRNEWGYVQLAFFNHRLPIRSVEFRAGDGDTWQPLERCLARWCGDFDAFGVDGPGAVFRLTSADPGVEPVETDLFPYSVGDDAVFDTGAQFADRETAGGACVFRPPGDVYDEGFGGIDSVRWESNTWGSTTLSEVGDGCAEDSASCLLLTDFADSGLHLTYRSPFPVDTFTTLSLALRIDSGTGTVNVAPRTAEGRCTTTTDVEVGTDWVTAEIDIAASCPDATEVQGLTVSWPSGPMNLMLDEIVFE